MRFLLAMLLLSAPVRVAAEFEAPPVLQAADLIGAERLTGEGYRIEPDVPTQGFLTRFTIDSDFGVFEARGPGMLDIRLHEIRALRELESMKHSEVFLEELGESARESGEAIAQAVTQPKETLRALPDGVNRFFRRTYRAGKTGVQILQEQRAEREASGAGDVTQAEAQAAASKTVELAADALGRDEQRRKLAKELGVDPYTTNEVLDAKLDEVANAAFAGSLTVSAATRAVPGGELIAATSRVSDWVWDTSPGDLRVAIEKGLVELGVPQAEVDALLRHSDYRLTLLASLENSLAELTGVDDRATVIPWALTADGADEARFVVLSALMLSRYHREVEPLDRVVVDGLLGAETKQAGRIVLGPVDYLAWTERVSEFLQKPSLQVPNRSLWLSGRASPLAHTSITSLGWSLEEQVLSSRISKPD